MVKQQQLDSSHHTLDGNIINGTTFWNERDGRHTSSGSSVLTSPENRTAPANTTPAASNDEIDTLEYIESGRIGYLTSFHEESARIWIIGSVVIAVIVGIVSHFNLNFGISITVIGIGVFTTRRSVEQLKKDFIWDTERTSHSLASGAKKGNETAESVEWLNEVIREVWPMVSPDLFVAGVDLLEDALKSLSPAVVHSVKVSSLHQGTNPLRLLGIRYLPSDTDITLPPNAKSTHSVQTGLPSLSSHREGEEPGSYVNLEAEFSYRRLPPSSALLPPSSHQTASSSPGFLLLLGIGLVKKIVKFDIPVSVSLIGLHGTCRLRLQVIADPPFVGRIQFCLTKLPAIEIVAKPLSSLSIDVMTFPGVSPFILSSINTVIKHFVVPKSYTIELSRFLLGSDVLMHTKSIGVICLIIHSASNLSSSTAKRSSRGPSAFSVPVTTSHTPKSFAFSDDADSLVDLTPELNFPTNEDMSSYQHSSKRSSNKSGSSELFEVVNGDESEEREESKICPFVNVAFSHLSKVLYNTRVLNTSRRSLKSMTRVDDSDNEEAMELIEEVEWEWEEIVFVRVALDDIEDDESLRLTVLDFDRSSPDDRSTIRDDERASTDEILGHVDISLQQLRSTPGIFERGNEKLRSLGRSARAQGRVKFSAAFFPLARTIPLVAEPVASALDSDSIPSSSLNTSVVNPELSLDYIHSQVDKEINSSVKDKDRDKEREKESKESNGKRKDKEKHRPMFTDRAQSEGTSRSGLYAQRMREMLDGRIPSNTCQKSGILSFQVHQLMDLVASTKSNVKDSLPSSYVRVFINEELAFKTGVKPHTATPYINLSHEYFLRDWTKSKIDFVVMDSVGGDHDIIIGAVTLELRELFSKNSQTTRWFPLQSGKGSGRLRLSLLFKPIDVNIEPCLRDWNIGTLAVTQLSIFGLNSSSQGKLNLAVEGGSSYDTQLGNALLGENNELDCFPSVLHFKANPGPFTGSKSKRYKIEFPSSEDDPIRLGVLNRHQSSLTFRFTKPNSKRIVEATYWISALSEGTLTRVVIPIYEKDSQHPPFARSSLPNPSMPIRKSKRYKPTVPRHPPSLPPPSHSRSHSEPESSTIISTTSAYSKQFDSTLSPPVIIGTLSFTIQWIPGVTELHRSLLPPSEQDMIKLFLLHPRPVNASLATTIPILHPNQDRGIRLGIVDSTHAHDRESRISGTMNQPRPASNYGGRRSGDSSRRTSFGTDEYHRESGDEGEGGKRKKSGWVKSMTRKFAQVTTTTKSKTS